MYDPKCADWSRLGCFLSFPISNLLQEGSQVQKANPLHALLLGVHYIFQLLFFLGADIQVQKAKVIHVLLPVGHLHLMDFYV